jgi:serine/threonine-protein kinase
MTASPIERLNAALTGRYVIDGELGEGGMATVYLADDLRHERKVALKVLKPELAAVVGADRFLAEIKTTANLQHPHILPLFDSGEADSFLFYVMPFIDGETLRDRLDRERQLPIDEALGIATAVANALHTAHELGVVHRDIKPGNILLSRGQPLVADFGIALAVGSAGGNRLTETGLSVGTPYYMSPEQATGDQVIGPASDTFALACVLYEMLVGEPPYPGATAQAVLGKIIQGVPVSATAVRRSIPLHVDAAIRKSLEKLPADRFTDAHEFAKALSDPSFRRPLWEVGNGGVWPWSHRPHLRRWQSHSRPCFSARHRQRRSSASRWLRSQVNPRTTSSTFPTMARRSF